MMLLKVVRSTCSAKQPGVWKSSRPGAHGRDLGTPPGTELLSTVRRVLAIDSRWFPLHRQSLAVANSPRAGDDQNFIDAVADWGGGSGLSK